MLHEFVIYEKRTGRITGHFRTSTPDLLPNPSSPELAFAPVTEESQVELLRTLDRSHRLAGSVLSDKVNALKLEPRHQGKLVLSCDARDLDQDGRAELPADGASRTRLEVRLVTADGRPIQEGAPVVSFAVTRGTLSSRTAKAQDGIATVELTSAAETVSTLVSAQAEGFEASSLSLEFLPVQEFKVLSQAGSGKA
ncbi:Ig-like domain-containing protein [Pelomonas sp. CA6]|uniref:Ig-like domain-containing protein n=1 Tax=Pelomonas sp. CA6 TaxID=2907999 RepID=UPI001F4B5B07|nr:Ig-like domain-containing protein [Pelomonas sp. CA6]MCH7342703.1 Ig-like domain-containing protein [Pelomonas sp. CA6]